MNTAKTLMDLITSEIKLAEQTEAIVADVLDQHGDDYDPWTEIMEQGHGYPDDNYANAGIYAWLLHDHLVNDTAQWSYETVSANTEMGSSGFDSWNDVLEHLVHIGLMTERA